MNEIAGRSTSGQRDVTKDADTIEEHSNHSEPASSDLANHPSSASSLPTDSNTDQPLSPALVTGEQEEPTVLIRPTQGWLDLGLTQVWSYRELLLALAQRDIKLRYRQTALGATWVVLQPLMAAGVFTIIFGKIARIDTGGVPPFLFYYAALLGWNVFNNTLGKASGCIVGNAGLISKIYFPRLILPFSVVFSTLLDFMVASCVMVALLFIYRVPPTAAILLLPVWLALLMLCALGIGLVTSAWMVTYRDVGHILPVATQMLMYVSPVIYPLSEALARTSDWMHIFFYLNPLTGLIEAFRWSLLGTGSLLLWPLVYSAVFSIAMFFAGMIAFHKKERLFADTI